MELEKFCDEIKLQYGDNLKSIVLYGSAVSGDHNKKYSDYNVLIVLNTLGLEQLKKISRITNKWVKAGNPPPLIFTVDDINTSTDVFPIEFLDIKESNRILHGEDVFKDITIDTRNLRLQCEYELKGKLIKLHEAYILTEGNPKKVGELLSRSLSTFQIMFKNVLRLKGLSVPVQKKEAMNLLVEAMNLDGSVFNDIAEMRDNPKTGGIVNVDGLLERYISQLRKIIAYVDKGSDS